MKFCFFASLSLLLLAPFTGVALEPILAIPDQLVLDETFDQDAEILDKKIWQPRQATRWSITNGILVGLPSSAENQTKKTHHRGLEPRLSIPATPSECIARFSIRFLEGEETTIVPFIEFGHHIVRLRLSETEGASLVVDYESLKVAEAPNFPYEPGKWIHVLAELKGEEFLVQIEDGPTLYAKHPVISQPAPSGGNGLGVAGPRDGKIEIDNIKIWTVKPTLAEGWAKFRSELPEFAPVQVRKKPSK